MTTEIAVNTVGALALAPDQTEWTAPQVAALEQMGIHDAPMGDQLVFLHQAQRTGLDPFARQIYMISRWDQQSGRKKYTIQAGIDGLRVIAERTGRYEGRTPWQWCGEDGVWRNVWLDPKRSPTAARCAVYKRGFREPLEAVAHFKEFAQTKKGGELTSMWATKGAHMIGKVAEALALRAAFPQDLSGVYIPEEMAGEEEPPPAGRGQPGETVSDAVAEEYRRPSGEPMVNAGQLREIARLVQALGLGKDDALAVYAGAAGRDVPHSRLLTQVEADAVIAEFTTRLTPAAEAEGEGPVEAEIVDDSAADGEAEAVDVWRDLVDRSGEDEEELTQRYMREHEGRHPSGASAQDLAAWAQGASHA